MTSKMINNFNVNSLNIITQSGFKNNLNAYFKNINILGKKIQIIRIACRLN